MSKLRTTGLVAVLMLAAACSKDSNKHAPDNTGHNADPAVVTNGDHAAQSGADLDLTQKVRKAIVDDSTLSTNAHNCKIVVDKGVVTLLGPVADASEKTKVVELAKQAGAAQIVDQLEVANSAAKPVNP